ncbi:MAG: hypothetical protein LLG97_12915 [Deltaproteobacteria bacterium]|nr:hypothetical protein [Deltaproteobacteria bacterium]
MSEETKETSQEEVEKNNPYPPAARPSAIANIDLEALRRVYGENFGTSGYGIIKATPDMGKVNMLKLTAWANECKKDDADPQILLPEGTIILKECFADYNSLKHLFGQYDARWAIQLGEILITQKDIVRKAKLEWGQWAAEKLPFIGKRTREKFMNLAKRNDCHQYSFLGVDRLDVLCSATKDNDEDDRIGAFMSKYEILFDPTKEFDPQEFKILVDTALNRARLIKHDLPADKDFVRDLTIAGKEINGSLIKKMQDVRACGGDPAEYLKNLTATAGQDSKDDDDDKKTVTDFNSLSSRLIRTIDYLVKDKEDEIAMVDSDMFIKLLKKLSKLQKLASINLEPEKAA